MKFQEVYKNNLEEVDTTLIQDGAAYGYLKKRISGLFGAGSSVTLVDSPSMSVSDNDGRRYEFTLSTKFDLRIVQDKSVMDEKLSKDQTYRDKWMIGDVTIKDLVCNVKFYPEFAY